MSREIAAPLREAIDAFNCGDFASAARVLEADSQWDSSRSIGADNAIYRGPDLQPAHRRQAKCSAPKTHTTIAALAALGALTLPASALANPLSPTEWLYNRAALCTSTSQCSPAQPFAGQLYNLNESYQPYSNKGNSLVYGFTGTGCATSQPGSELQLDWAGHLQWEFPRQAPTR